MPELTNVDDQIKFLVKAKVNNPDVTTTELSKVMGISQSTVSNRLRSEEFKKAFAPFHVSIEKLKDKVERKAWLALHKNLSSSDERVRNAAANAALTALGKDPERTQVSQNNLFIFRTSISGDGTISNERIPKIEQDERTFLLSKENNPNDDQPVIDA